MQGKQAALTLKENLVDLIVQHMESGEKLPSEKEMMQRFNVSRTTLREVLSAYQANGIIVSRQGSGYYVQKPDVSKQILETWSILLRCSPSYLLDLLELRKILEISTLPKALERISTEQLQTLGKQVEGMKQKAKQGLSFVEEDRTFHHTLFASTNNYFLEQLLSTFWDLFASSKANRAHENLVAVAEQHEQMLRAFAMQDLPQLTKLFEQQFSDARYQLMRSLMNL